MKDEIAMPIALDEICRLKADLAAATARAERAERERDEVRMALRPFEIASKIYDHRFSDDQLILPRNRDGLAVTIGDLRRAAALATPPQPDTSASKETT